jgi:hypothetical protein
VVFSGPKNIGTAQRMRKPALALLFLCAVGCTTLQPFRDATGRGRTVEDMQIDGAICQTVLPNPPAKQASSLCPACDLLDSAATKVKRKRIFDNCMKAHGWSAAR